MKKKQKDALESDYDSHDYYRMWWSKTIAHYWNRMRPGRGLHKNQLEYILASMARAAEVLIAVKAEETTSFCAREPFWRDLFCQGARELQGGHTLDLSGIHPLVKYPDDNKDWVLLQVLIAAVYTVE